MKNKNHPHLLMNVVFASFNLIVAKKCEHTSLPPGGGNVHCCPVVDKDCS